jgi:hypothetical protein
MDEFIAESGKLVAAVADLATPSLPPPAVGEAEAAGVSMTVTVTAWTAEVDAALEGVKPKRRDKYEAKIRGELAKGGEVTLHREPRSLEIVTLLGQKQTKAKTSW